MLKQLSSGIVGFKIDQRSTKKSNLQKERSSLSLEICPKGRQFVDSSGLQHLTNGSHWREYYTTLVGIATIFEEIFGLICIRSIGFFQLDLEVSGGSCCCCFSFFFFFLTIDETNLLFLQMCTRVHREATSSATKTVSFGTIFTGMTILAVEFFLVFRAICRVQGFIAHTYKFHARNGK